MRKGAPATDVSGAGQGPGAADAGSAARKPARIAVIGGDGIGPEVVEVAVAVLEAVAEHRDFDLIIDRRDLGADRYLRDGVTLSEDERDGLVHDCDAALLGALGDPRVPDNVHARDILLGLRFFADLYINYRPCKLVSPELSPLRDPDPGIDIGFFRENTEGLYTGMGGSFKTGTPDEIATETSLNTRRGVERIVRAAFEHADRGSDMGGSDAHGSDAHGSDTHGSGTRGSDSSGKRGSRRVTLVDKANAMVHEGALWRRVFAEVGERYPHIEQDAMYVDAMAMDLVRRPERYDTVVTSNLFGDILSDLGAQVTGGLGLAPSANLHPGRWALFEPVHGSAPDIAGRGIANPLAATACAALLLRYLGHDEAAAAVDRSIAASIREGVVTPDLGGSASTQEVGAWLVDRLGAEEAALD